MSIESVPSAKVLTPAEENALLLTCVQGSSREATYALLEQFRWFEQDLLQRFPTQEPTRGIGEILQRAHLRTPSHLRDAIALRNAWTHGKLDSLGDDALFCLAAVLRARRLLVTRGELHEGNAFLRGTDFFYEAEHATPIHHGPPSAWDVERARRDFAASVLTRLRYTRDELEPRGTVLVFASQLRDMPRMPSEISLLANRARATLLQRPEPLALTTADLVLAITWFERQRARLLS